MFVGAVLQENVRETLPSFAVHRELNTSGKLEPIANSVMPKTVSGPLINVPETFINSLIVFSFSF